MRNRLDHVHFSINLQAVASLNEFTADRSFADAVHQTNVQAPTPALEL